MPFFYSLHSLNMHNNKLTSTDNMKKTLLLASMAITYVGYSQTFVSTTPQNKKVVLEEFTGIHCGYCPDGHRIANDLVKANPGKVFLINIHAGSFATPSAGEPDYRTSAGTAIDASAGVTGYPAGSVNRAKSPWASNRGAWQGEVTSILGQSSPVNVAVKASVDFATRQLTTEVEVYYTGNGTGTKNQLTVALTEDNQLGPQSDYGDYNPTNWVGEQYRHNHVLRQHITAGNWGESLDTVTQGKYYYRKYVTTIPANYVNTTCYLQNLNVVAFVSEGNNNIISADEAHADFDDALKTDLSIKDLTVKPTICSGSVNPKVEVTNLMDQTVSSFKISAIVNGVANEQTITQALAKNAKVTVDFGTTNFSTGGSYKISIGSIKTIKGTSNQDLVDVDITNDGANLSGAVLIPATADSKNVWCRFETTPNMFIDGSENSNASIPASGNYGSFSTRALRIPLHESWGGAGKPVKIVFGQADLSKITTPGLSYKYAYSDGGEGGSAPTIIVAISKDCGATWEDIHGAVPTETGQPTTAGQFYVPRNNQYNFVSVGLDQFKNDNVIARISVTPGTSGNAMYIDELSIASFSALGVKDGENGLAYSIFPNPSNGILNINLEEKANANVVIRTIEGKELSRVSFNGLEKSIDCSNFKDGIYFVEVEANGKRAVEKLIIAK